MSPRAGHIAGGMPSPRPLLVGFATIRTQPGIQGVELFQSLSWRGFMEGIGSGFFEPVGAEIGAEQRRLSEPDGRVVAFEEEGTVSKRGGG